MYKRQQLLISAQTTAERAGALYGSAALDLPRRGVNHVRGCLLYTSDAADERSSVDLGGRRIIKKKNDTAAGVCVADEHKMAE